MAIKVRCQKCGKLSQFADIDIGLVALCIACGERFSIPPEPDETGVFPALDGTESTEPDAGASTGAPATPADDVNAAAAALAATVGTQPVPIPVHADLPAPAPGAGDTPPPASAIAGLTAPPTVASPTATAPPAAPARPEMIPVKPILPRRPIVVERPSREESHPVRFALLTLALAGAIVGGILYRNAGPSWEFQNRATIQDLRLDAAALAAERKYQEAYDAYKRIDDLVAGRTIKDATLRAEVEQSRADRDALLKLIFAQVKDQYASVTLPKATDPPNPDGTVRVSVDGRAPSATSRPAQLVQNWPPYVPKALPESLPATAPASSTRPADPSLAESPATSPPTTVASAAEPRRNARSATAPALPRARITVRRRAAADASDGLTDEAIGQAIQRGATNLLGQFQGGRLHGADIDPNNDAYQTGLNALCVYALLQASLATGDERLNLKGPLVRDLINKMKMMPAETGPVTYARGIRATALALLNRPEDKAALKQDVNYLLSSHVNGAYGYAKPVKLPPGQAIFADSWDNSNSQYGLLGVWSGAEVGAEVNANYWQAVETHWVNSQLPTGAWDYTTYRPGPRDDGILGMLGGGGGGDRGEGRPSMTVAGVASLFVTHDYLDVPKAGARVGRPPFSPALARGLDFLESGNNAIKTGGGGGYALYGLERVGLASGFKFFGSHDWYRELAAPVINNQAADGSWGSDVETAYHLLFLARGRHPILMNKLRYEGSWANRPRDVANLARFGTKELERPLNWQVVPLDRPWTDWMDSPILYLASHKKESFDTTQIDRLRNFVNAGGMLFTQADGSKPEANAWAEYLAKKLFPAYEMTDLPADHDIYTMLYKPADRPPLRAVSNGSRLLMLHSATDITQNWQLRMDRTRRGLFELGLNVFLYATGKGDLRNRLSSPVLPEPPLATGGRITVARVKYPSNWDPEPGAWPRFARYFQRETNVGLDVAPTELKNLNPHVAGFAHWTGTAAYTPTDTEIATIRKYVTDGGVLLVEPTGGAGDFYETAKAALLKAFPEARPEMIPKTHPMLVASGPAMDDLSKPLTRAYVKARNYGTTGRIDAITVGRGKVILSPLDLTTGLVGCNAWGVLGFDKDYALKLTKNLLLWSATGMPEDP